MDLAELGRGIVVRPGADAGPEWAGVERLRVCQVSAPLVDRLHLAFLQRRPLVLELAVASQELRQPESCDAEPYELSPDFRFLREQLHFLVWANNYDATGGEPIWWHGRLARRLGGPEEVDGGPRTSLPQALVHRESVEIGRVGLTHPLEGTAAELAQDQRKAVLHRGGAAAVLAPAGSGKTRVLTERLRHLLACGVEAERVTALAYNRRAALEMRTRLPGAGACIKTLHALGYGLLRSHRSVRLANEREQRALLSRLVKPPALLNQDPLQPYLEGLQRIRLGLMNPHEVEDENAPGLADAFPLYRQALAERGWVDHDEQIYGALELLLRQPEVRKAAQRTCTHLLVDEFQDLTPGFLLMVRLLAGPAQQVFGVGDDDQVIYGYAGATPDYLVRFEHYFPGAARHQLEVNYRCPPGIVEAASRLLSHNRERVPKQIRAAESRLEGQPELVLQPERAVEIVAGWVQEHGPTAVAVLARVNSLLMPIQVWLREHALPHTAAVDASVLQRTGLRSALAYLRLAQGRFAAADLNDALRRPNRKLRRELIEQACDCKDLTGLRRFAHQQSDWVAEQIEDFCGSVSRLQHSLRKGVPAFFACLRMQTDFLDAIEQLDQSGLGASGGSSHRDDLLGLEQTARAYRGEPDGFEAWLESHLSAPPSEEGVRLSSVHRVKGLEWPFVLVYGVEMGLMPHRLSEDLEEERRILHVALTRARRHCVLVADPARLSPFVQQMMEARAPKKKKKKKKRR